METKILDIASTHTDADLMDNSRSSLINQEPVENTPFTLITTDEGSFCAMGLYRITEIYPSKDEAISKATSLTWNNLVTVMMIIAEKMKSTSIAQIQNENQTLN
jgi:hypothetical protein